MALRSYVWIWLVITAFLSYEFAALNGMHWPSLLLALDAHHILRINVSPVPGRPLSLWLGWIGLGLMLIMNVYSLRKRAAFLRGRGRLVDWLNFHVFCGLLGPTFILFHCNFKVHGLVAISFWSMMISLTSGVIGRYFYLQLVTKKVDLQRAGDEWLLKLKKFVELRTNARWKDHEYAPFLRGALAVAGMPTDRRGLNPVVDLAKTAIGDFRMNFMSLPIPAEWPYEAEWALKEYAVHIRRAATLESFRRLMGYWHAFHFPFAIFMYLAAAVHVAASLVFSF